MRTNIVLDDLLVGEAMRTTGLKTKRAVVHLALAELVRLRKRSDSGALQCSKRGFPISTGGVPFSSIDVARIEEEED